MTADWTPERIGELRSLCAAATSGPWRHFAARLRANAAFIAAARDALPAALDEIERLRARVVQLETWLAEEASARDQRREQLLRECLDFAPIYWHSNLVARIRAELGEGA